MTSEKDTERLGDLLAHGRTSRIYSLKKGQVAKIFLDRRPQKAIALEFRITRLVHEAGYPSPTLHKLLSTQQGNGFSYEWIPGHTLLDEVKGKPWRFLWAMNIFAQLHHQMHQLQVAKLPAQRQRLHDRIDQSHQLGQKQKELILKLLNNLPDGNFLCHGDFHPENIIIGSQSPVVIDWYNAVSGNPLCDVARTVLLLTFSVVPKEVSFWERKVVSLGRKYIPLETIYLRNYVRQNPFSQTELQMWVTINLASRLYEKIPGEEELLLKLLSQRIVS